MRLRPGPKLSAVLFFYLSIALLVVVFSPYLHAWIYPLLILASLLFVLALKLKVPLNGFLAGAAAATLAMAAVVGTLVLLGAIEIGPLRDNYAFFLLSGIYLQLLVGFGEELSFRAAIFQGLFEEVGIWPATLLSAAGFALLHIPSMELLGIGTASGLIALGTIFLAGIVLALLYAYGGLFNAVAFHATWNFIEYNLLNTGPLGGAISVAEPGPAVLTGGAFGLEASVVTLIVNVLLAAAVWLYYARRRKMAGAQTLSA